MLIAAFSLAIPVLAMTSLMQGRLPGTHDAWLHLMRLINATLNLEAGSLIPRWGPHLHFGFGYPLGNFYAPGWHILGGVLVALGTPAVWVWLLFQSIGIVLYPVGGYLFAQLFTNRAGALVGAAVCLFAPLRFYEIFVQGNLSQFIAMGLIAWVLWAFGRCAFSPNLGRVVIAALMLAALIMTHHPTAAFMIPFTGLYAVFAAFVAPSTGKRKWQIISVLVAYALGLLLSATYWLPALTEVQYVNVQAAAEQFQLQDNFVLLRDLFGTLQPPDRGSLNMPYTLSIGQLQLALAVVGSVLVLVLRSRASRWQRVHVIGGLVVALVGAYAITYQSLWLWQTIPKASLILFPWRLLGLVAVALIPAAGFILEAIPAKWRSISASALIGALFLSVVPVIAPLYPDWPDLGTVTPATGIEYEIASGNLGGVSNNEYLPRWPTQRPDFLPCPDCYTDWKWQVFVNTKSLPNGVTVNSISTTQPRSSAYSVAAPAAFDLELHQMYFPGWSAALDGQPVDLKITQPYGLMVVSMPAGTHNLEVWYAGTTTQHFADTISVVAVFICIALLYLHFRKRQPAQSNVTSPSYSTAGKMVIVGSTLSAVVLAGFIQPNSGLLRTQGNISAPIGMEHRTNTTFADKNGKPLLELIGYSLTQNTVRYGEWLHVTLYWRALRPVTDSWSVKVTLADPVTQAEWAISDHAAPGGFPTSKWVTDKYIVDQNILRITSDAPPYVGDLIVQVYSPQGETLTAQNTNRFRLTTIRVSENGRNDLPAGVQPVDVKFGDWLRLRGFSLKKIEQSWQLRLYWEVLRAPEQDYVLMLHMMKNNEDISAADQSPIPSYPTQDWQKGQFLESAVNLSVPPDADTLFFGLYDRAGVQRLPITISQGKLQTANQGILLPLVQTN